MGEEGLYYGILDGRIMLSQGWYGGFNVLCEEAEQAWGQGPHLKIKQHYFVYKLQINQY